MPLSQVPVQVSSLFTSYRKMYLVPFLDSTFGFPSRCSFTHHFIPDDCTLSLILIFLSFRPYFVPISTWFFYSLTILIIPFFTFGYTLDMSRLIRLYPTYFSYLFIELPILIMLISYPLPFCSGPQSTSPPCCPWRTLGSWPWPSPPSPLSSLSYRRLSSQFQFSLSVADLGIYLYGCACLPHAQSTYIYRVQSSVWRSTELLTPTPSPPSECVLPPHQRRGVHTRRAGRGVGGQYLGRRHTLDWPLTV